MNIFKKKYQVWERCSVPKDGTEYYTLTEYDNLNEAILASKTQEWYLTKAASVQITDAEEQPITTQPNVIRNIPINTERTDEADPAAEELAAKYAGGPIGNITN